MVDGKIAFLLLLVFWQWMYSSNKTMIVQTMISAHFFLQMYLFKKIHSLLHFFLQMYLNSFHFPVVIYHLEVAHLNFEMDVG